MMSRQYRGRSSRNYYGGYGRSNGREAAKRHIREAEEFSREMGGSDRDVKAYFFGLDDFELDAIFSEYGSKYGWKAEDYARSTIDNWRTGATKMSGLVAKRLFSFLPSRMPLNDKYQLAENIWIHFGPSSRHSFMVGPATDLHLIASTVQEKLDATVTSYDIPENIKKRFDWLSHGDVSVKEQLLNHFRQLEKEVARQKLFSEIPLLQKQMRDHPENSNRLKSIIEIYKHVVEIWVVDELGDEIKDGAPAYSNSSAKGGLPWFWIIVAVIVVVYLIVKN